MNDYYNNRLRKHAEAEKLLKEDLYPNEIAKKMGVGTGTVIQYLQTRVGMGSIVLSDIYFSWPDNKRKILYDLLEEKNPTQKLKKHNLDLKELEYYRSLRDLGTKFFYGDLYTYISGLERKIHHFVKDVLKKQYSDDSNDWYEIGISSQIRQECASKLENDSKRTKRNCDALFGYTMLIQLSEIIKKNKKIFIDELPKKYKSGDLKLLQGDFRKLNDIRNNVMHPVRMKFPTREDFHHVKGMYNIFYLDK